ncbi:SpoIIE family protein phosphatase [Streptomyces sp. TRM66268-LWL]|uniref:SpoIIE family protein phosphatase n=1 Tax=Streptomyces polyasparticus TaxID=2767826 RepID=A0ABR7SVB6_9ACTN|nr:SpoIIE family protein phosphatase [Streptomyces polyasparticus]MBC9719451.1 SpoIIE family protein phosphatase [Streptomyces polyasparticus]
MGAPLGLADLAGGAPAAWTVPFQEGSVMVLYTDGVTEARGGPDGAFYPLQERLEVLCASIPWPPLSPARCLPPTAAPASDPGGDPLGALVATLYDDLVRYTGGSLDDDAVLLLLARAGSVQSPADPRTVDEAGE